MPLLLVQGRFHPSPTTFVVSFGSSLSRYLCSGVVCVNVPSHGTRSHHRCINGGIGAVDGVGGTFLSSETQCRNDAHLNVVCHQTLTSFEGSERFHIATDSLCELVYSETILYACDLHAFSQVRCARYRRRGHCVRRHGGCRWCRSLPQK